ncbi:MAG TPA: exodeoxyribonuclease V subunit gamma, partial [Kofleriaceae bacterium]|nr:exodeoxyribonuclease V subunit gamma [Kofleriaceae bacterium]
PLGALFAGLAPADLALPGPLHLFGFSHLARGYWPIISRLAEAGDVRVYALNPCREFWDDLASASRGRDPAVATGREERAGRGALDLDGDGDGEAASEEPPALALWGRPGREHVAALNRLCGWDFRDRFADPIDAGGEATALRRLQRDILDRAPARGEPVVGDGSVRVLACPGVRRELEIIGNEIAALLCADPSLRLSDIAVLLAPDECERYQAQVGAVFGELGGIRHRVADLPLESESRVVEAIDLLFDLPLGRFTRPELLGLMVHPAVLAGHPEIDRDDWIRWCDELGIVHGADQRDHRGTYIDRDVFNWDQGVRRLALGSFMSPDGDEGAPAALRLGGQVYRPARVEQGERRSAARFALLARSLIADARACRERERPLAEWARHLDALAASYLVPVTPADERALDRCREAIRQLAALDLAGQPIGYRTARELARDALAGLRSAGGELPSDAVLVAPLAPMRPLPFRVLFVAGLGAGHFPGGERDLALDVRTGAPPRPGEVGPRERDRYTFLEAVLSARDRLYLSYVARDEGTGEELEPSSLVQELRAMLEPYLGRHIDNDTRDGDADGAGLIVRHPLRRYQPGGGRDPVAERQAACAALRRDLVEHCAARGLPVPDAGELAAELARPERAGLRARLGLGWDRPVAGGARRARRAQGEPLVLSLAALRRFLECPLQAWATSVLGLRQEDDEDLVAQRDEPFERGPLASAIALREVFLAHLADGRDDAGGLERRYRERLVLDEQGGLSPCGPFARADELRAVEVLCAWWNAMARASGGRPPAALPIGFGWVHEGSRVGQLEPAIELTVARPDGDLPVLLVGRSEPIAGALGSLLMVAGDDPSPRYRVRGAIDRAALAAAGLLPGEGRHAMTILAGSGRAHRYRFAPVTEAEARAYLASLVEDLLSRAHDYLLPCEAVLVRRRRASVADAVREMVAGGRFFSSRGGPLRIGPHLAAPADADRMIAQRFGPWWDAMEDIRE